MRDQRDSKRKRLKNESHLRFKGETTYYTKRTCFGIEYHCKSACNLSSEAKIRPETKTCVGIGNMGGNGEFMAFEL